MNLGRCSHSIKGKGAGAKSKSKGSKVTAENSAVAPEGGEGCDIDPWVGIPAQDTANTHIPSPKHSGICTQGRCPNAPGACLGLGKGRWCSFRVTMSFPILKGHSGCAPSRVLCTHLKDSAKKSPEMSHLASLVVLLCHLSFSETPWKFIPAKLPWRTPG